MRGPGRRRQTLARRARVCVWRLRGATEGIERYVVPGGVQVRRGRGCLGRAPPGAAGVRCARPEAGGRAGAGRAASDRGCPLLSSAGSRLAPALGTLGCRQKHSLPDLPYDYGALEPHINAQIMQLHHSKHHAAYVNNLNVAEEKYREALAKGGCPAPAELRAVSARRPSPVLPQHQSCPKIMTPFIVVECLVS